MNGWDDLERELDFWSASGRVASLWWRDDDAVAATPALATLKALARIPVALAVVPGAKNRPLVVSPSADSLANVIADWPQVAILQHGFAHDNHAPAREKKSEFPLHRSLAEALHDLAEGKALLEGIFKGQFLRVMTPPWNRISPALVARLPDVGFVGLSRFGPRLAPQSDKEEEKVPIEINCHVDLIDWRGGRSFVGEGAALSSLTRHLRQRREGMVDPAEPTGILSHHLVHDAATWRFLENLQDWLIGRSEIRFLETLTLWRSNS